MIFYQQKKLFLGWGGFVTSKIIKKLVDTLFTKYVKLFFDEDSGNVPFLVIKWVF